MNEWHDDYERRLTAALATQRARGAEWPQPNEHGVFVPGDHHRMEILIAKHEGTNKRLTREALARIYVLQVGPDEWVSAHNYQFTAASMGGGGSYPSVLDDHHPSRAAAILAEASYLAKHGAEVAGRNGGEAREARKLVAWSEQQIADARDGTLFKPRPDAEVDIIERYSTSAEQQDEALDELSADDLVQHLAGLFDELEDEIKHTPDGERRQSLIATRDQTLADLEQLVGAPPRQMELSL